jgi:CRISPR-associated endonuclease/helicase Cas3
LETFRGAGQLDVWTYDPGTNAVKSISLLRLFSETDFELISENKVQKITIRFKELLP